MAGRGWRERPRTGLEAGICKLFGRQACGHVTVPLLHLRPTTGCLTFQGGIPRCDHTVSSHCAGADPNLHRKNSCVWSAKWPKLHLILWPLGTHSMDMRVLPFMLHWICSLLTQPESKFISILEDHCLPRPHGEGPASAGSKLGIGPDVSP